MSVSYGGDSITFADGSVTSSGWTGFKNRIINGAMMVDQRNAGANVTPSGAGSWSWPIDRFGQISSVGSKIKYGQNLNSISPPSGFINYFGAQTVSANTVSAGDYHQIIQKIEGYNVSDLDMGLSTAKTATLSFWVYSSISGEHSGGITNDNAGSSWRTYVFSYTINQANTWEYKTITIPGDITGTWNKGNTCGYEIRWSLGIGSTYQKAQGSWGTGIYAATSGGAKIVETLNATFYITGVQLEKGSTASSFEYRPYGTELALCQRYCYVQGGNNNGYSPFASGQVRNSTLSLFYKAHPVPMRANPSVTINSPSYFIVDDATAWVPTAVALDRYTDGGMMIAVTTTSGPTSGRGALLYSDSSGNARITVTSEL